MSAPLPYGAEIPRIYQLLHPMSVVVVALSCFTIYVILYQTPKAMKSYSRYLLFYQIVSTLYDFSALYLTTPWLTLPVIGGVTEGPITQLGFVSTEVQTTYGVVLVVLLLVSVIELYFQRQQSIVPEECFHKLKKQWQIAGAHIAMGLGPIGALVFMTCIFMNNHCDKEKLAVKFPQLAAIIRRDGYMCITEENQKWITYFIIPTTIVITYIIGAMLFTTVYYLYRPDIKVSPFSPCFSLFLRKMFIALLIQSTVPFDFLLVPMMLGMYITANDRIDLVHWNPYIIALTAFHGPASTVLVLVCYSPYWEYCKKLFGTLTSKVFSPKPVLVASIDSVSSFSSYELKGRKLSNAVKNI